MYTLSSKLKTFSIVLIVLGLIGTGWSFFNVPKTTEEVEQILAASHHGHGAHDTHAAHAEDHSSDATVAPEAVQVAVADSLAPAVADAPVQVKSVELSQVDEHAAHQKHLEHVLHQLQNKPWAAVYIAAIFFMLLTMGALVFFALQQVAQAGWSPVLFRVMEGITAYLPIGSVIFFLLLLASGLHFNHLFVWMADGITDPTAANYDKIVAGKAAYLNVPFWLIRAAIFLIGWNIYRAYAAKKLQAQDEAEAGDISNYKQLFKGSAGFLVFFIVSESIMSWDWIMSLDPHWYSTLFGWYVFASFFVSGITTICMVTIYLQAQGHLPKVNTSHIHDLAKFMFGISVFWTYLWFSQFMLIWYANIPEEVTYFVQRINDFNLPFFGMLFLNFVFPLVVLVNTDFKRISWILVIAGIVILVGHYVDFYIMITPATVGASWSIGIPEISAIFFFLGLFLLVVFNALAKKPLELKNHPLLEESEHFHY